jgi:maleamate amidohydrolase
MPGWDKYLSERDKELFPMIEFGRPAGFGERPVMLVVDVSYAFTGERREPIFESVKSWANSCGEEAWVAMEVIARLLEGARAKGLPVFYTTGPAAIPGGVFGLGRWKDKMAHEAADAGRAARGNEIVAEIAPQDGDVVVEKGKPSAFFGTLFPAYLADLGADSVIVAGTTTSGCVRASVLDGFSYNYRMIVAEDAVFDRGEASHWVSLFDMQMKYADVMPVDDILEYFETLPDDLFAGRLPAAQAAH